MLCRPLTSRQWNRFQCRATVGAQTSHDWASEWIAWPCRCTMTSPSAQRHLRDARGGQLEAAGLLAGSSVAADGSGTRTAAPQQPNQRWPGDRSAVPRAMAASEADCAPAQVTTRGHTPPCTRSCHAHCTSGNLCSLSAVQVVQAIRTVLFSDQTTAVAPAGTAKAGHRASASRGAGRCTCAPTQHGCAGQGAQAVSGDHW